MHRLRQRLIPAYPARPIPRRLSRFGTALRRHWP